MKALLLVAMLAGAIVLPGARAAAQASGAGQLTLQQRIDAAAPEDIIVIDGGVFHESVVIDKPISLIGHNWPVIDGGGLGDVVTISADDVVVSGFVIRNSGTDMSREPAAVRIDNANRVTVRANRLQDARFGIHVTTSKDSILENNLVDTGGDRPIERRGHGIYLWEVQSSTVHANTIQNAADGIHLEYSDDNGIGDNDVHQSRYALHLMYAHQNKIIDNNFHDNLAGAVVMLSHDVIIKGNNLSGNRKGATGTGMLFKDDDNLFVEDNRLLRNKYGMTVDGAPQAIGATAIFRHNLFALNDVGVAAMSNAPITFVENAMIDNTVQVKAMSGDLASRTLSGHGETASGADAAPAIEGGGALPTGAVWSSGGRGNYWSDYRGYDANGDGVGDQPYRPRPTFAGRLGNDDTLRLFQFTPAQQAIDVAADMFPVYRYNAIIEDDGPLMNPPGGLALAHGAGINLRLLACSLLLAALAAAGIFAGAGAHARQSLRRALTTRRQGPATGDAAA